MKYEGDSNTDKKIKMILTKISIDSESYSTKCFHAFSSYILDLDTGKLFNEFSVFYIMINSIITSFSYGNYASISYKIYHLRMCS